MKHIKHNQKKKVKLNTITISQHNQKNTFSEELK